MAKTLVEMRTSPAVGLPERSVQICLAQALVAKVQTLSDEKSTLEIEQSRNADGTPQRLSDRPDPRIAEIDAELEGLWDQMREHTGDLLVRGADNGTWRRWVHEHPVRDKETPEGQLDQNVSYGFCNADDLVDDLGTYAVSWNGEPVAEGDWEFIASKAALGDLKNLARTVVLMHESEGVRAPKVSLRRSSASLPSETASPSPEPSGSPNDGSSAGNPASGTSTTTPPGD